MITINLQVDHTRLTEELTKVQRDAVAKAVAAGVRRFEDAIARDFSAGFRTGFDPGDRAGSFTSRYTTPPRPHPNCRSVWPPEAGAGLQPEDMNYIETDYQVLGTAERQGGA